MANLLFAGALALAADDRLALGDAAPNFVMKTLNADASKQRVVMLQSLVGAEATDKKKAIVLSFLGSACEPCKKELAFYGALNAEFRDKGLAVVGDAVDKDDAEMKKLADVIIAGKTEFAVMADRFNIVSSRYRVQKTPAVYLIDGGGKIAWAELGDDPKHAELLGEVRKALGLPVSDPPPPALAAYFNSPSTAAEAEPAVALDGDPKKVKKAKEKKPPKKKGAGKP